MSGIDHEAENRVARLASRAGILAQVGYKRCTGRYGGKPAVVARNTLDRQFGVDAPDRVWVTDITCIKTHEGWLYLAVVIDLFSRCVIGWSAQPRMTTNLALQALLAAVWRRKPRTRVMIHSDQGSQSTSREWQLFLGLHNLDASMSRRGNCHDNAVAESVFQLLKRERIRRRTYLIWLKSGTYQWSAEAGYWERDGRTVAAPPSQLPYVHEWGASVMPRQIVGCPKLLPWCKWPCRMPAGLHFAPVGR